MTKNTEVLNQLRVYSQYGPGQFYESAQDSIDKMRRLQADGVKMSNELIKKWLKRIENLKKENKAGGYVSEDMTKALFQFSEGAKYHFENGEISKDIDTQGFQEKRMSLINKENLGNNVISAKGEAISPKTWEEIEEFSFYNPNWIFEITTYAEGITPTRTYVNRGSRKEVKAIIQFPAFN